MYDILHTDWLHGAELAFLAMPYRKDAALSGEWTQSDPSCFRV